MRQPKLIELLDDLAIASNMADMAEDPGTQRVLKFHLRRAQTFLYWKTDWRNLIATFTFNTVAGQTQYDYPTLTRTIDGVSVTDTLEPSRILSETLKRGTARYPVLDGINPLLYTVTNRMQPYRLEAREQLELFPAPDAVYPIYLQGCIALRPFRDDDDRATIHGDTILELAAAAVKGNWGQADAGAYAQQAAALLRTLNANAHGNKRYIPGAGVRTPSSPLSPNDLALMPWAEPTLADGALEAL